MQYFLLPYTKTSIQKQFRELSKKLHPDKKGGNETEFKKMVSEKDTILQAIDRINLQFPARKPKPKKKVPLKKKRAFKSVQMKYKYLHIHLDADEFFNIMDRIINPM